MTITQRRGLQGCLVVMLAWATIALAGCSKLPASVEASVRSATRGQRFSIVGWELKQLLPRRIATPTDSGGRPLDDEQVVRRYVDTVARLQKVERNEAKLLAEQPSSMSSLMAVRLERDALIAQRDALRPAFERALSRQVRHAYRAAGIYGPADRLVRFKVSFPPVAFTVEALPHLLIVSPRDRIASVREVLLLPETTTEQMEAIEAAVEAQGYSALVDDIGGLGATYPTFVEESANLKGLARVVAEEWLHQYLAFTPVGWRYVLDRLKLRPDDAIARINEGAATIVSDEIAANILAEHYRDLLPPSPKADERAAQAPDSSEEPRFVFNREMRVTRLHVDELLAAGDVAGAEAYMEERRQVFVANGYALRKLNQAYFAFHGNYAVPSSDEEALPPELADPIGAQLRALRAQSASLADFVDRVASLRSAEDLARAVGK